MNRRKLWLPGSATAARHGALRLASPSTPPVELTWAEVIAADAPFAWYRLNEAAGNVVTDNSGNARHGSILAAGNAARPTIGVASLIATDAADKAYSFDGGDHADPAQVAVAGIATQVTPTAATWSMEAWAKPGAGAAASGRVVSLSNTAAGNQLITIQMEQGVALATARWQTQWRGDGSTLLTLTSDVTVSIARADHLVLTQSATQLTLYVNGIQKAQVAVNTGTATYNSARIGNTRTASENGFFTGVIDDVVFYDYDLTAARVLAHYQAGT